MYKWFFISTYRYYSRFKNETPRVSTTAVVTVSQFVTTLLLLVLVKRLGVWDFTVYVPSKFIAVPIMLAWMAIVYRYYSMEKITLLLKRFEEFPKWRQ